MGNSAKPQHNLSDFQKAKLLHEFKTFFGMLGNWNETFVKITVMDISDLDGDGVVAWNDFKLAKEVDCCFKEKSLYKRFDCFFWGNL